MRRSLYVSLFLCIPLRTSVAWVEQFSKRKDDPCWPLYPRRYSDAAVIAAVANNNDWSSSGDDTSTDQGRSSSGPQEGRKQNQPQNDNSNILEDSTGHVNRELAERIWNWEQEHRKDRNLPQVEYSVRSGLRLVDQMVSELLEVRQGQDSRKTVMTTTGRLDQRDDDLYSELVQEGLSALLDAMSHYRQEEEEEEEGNEGTTHHHHHHTSSEDFETYARQRILRQLEGQLENDARAIRLPKSVKSVVQRARSIVAAHRQDDRRQGRNEPPSMTDIAKELGIPVERLQDYLQLAKTAARRTISMESTVEIMHPMLDDSGPEYTDQDEWELQQGWLLHDELVEDYMDEMIQHEGEDEAWIQQQEQIAGPLQELIPDTEEPSPDDLAVAEMIRHDLSEFLTDTLEPQQVRIVRLIFGLDSGKAMSLKQTAETMGLPKQQVSDLLKDGIDKLRAAYKSSYVETYLDDEPGSIEESV